MSAAPETNRSTLGAPEEQANLTYDAAQDRMALLPNYYAWISSHFVSELRGTVLELGSGAGFVVRSYADRVVKVVAVDLEEKLLAQLAASYPPGKIRTAKVDLAGA